MNKIFLLFLIIVVSLFGLIFTNQISAQTSNIAEDQSMAESLEITSLRITYSNASIAPNYRKTTTWYLTNQDEEFKKLAADVVVNSKVNEASSIKDFFENPETVPPLKDSAEQKGSGSGQYDVVMTFNNGKTIKMGDYASYALTQPYYSLYELTMNKGVKTVTDGDPEDNPIL